MRRLALLVLVGCSARAHPTPSARAPRGDDVTLYRDAAVIRQRIELDLPATTTSRKVQVAAGVRAAQIMVVEKADLDVVLYAPTNPRDARDEVEPADEPPEDVEGTEDVEPEAPPPPADQPAVPAPPLHVARRDKPVEITLDITPKHAGHYTIVLAYITDRLDWNVAYTMTASPTRERAEVRGALAIFNTTGISIRAASARLIDAELGAWRTKTSESLAATLVAGTPSSTPPAQPRELGPLELGDGETRVEIVGAMTRAMSSVLVYDPIGTKLDHTGASPLTDESLGIVPPAADRVTESFEVSRDKTLTSGLPAGPVRLLDARTDGTLAVLGEASLFDAATRVGDVDTIPVGMADGVTGTRERHELTVDDSTRIVEEFVITIENKRAYPVRVLIREHLYRGQNWTLAYHSEPDATKEGPQQIAMRTHVPAKSQTKIMYVVVYTWPQ